MSLRRSLQFALALAVACVALAFGSAAGAVENPDYTAPPPSTAVTNETLPTIRQVTDSSQSTSAPTAQRQRLAITGADSMQLVVIGGVLLAGGAATLVVRRRVTA